MSNKLNTDGLVVLIIVIVVLGAVSLAGGIKSIGLSQPDANSIGFSSGYACCDTGDGDNCKLTDKRVTWKGTNSKAEEYALLKSNIALTEGTGHIAPARSDPEISGVGTVFLNTSNEAFPNGYPIEYSPGSNKDCQIPGQDFVFKKREGTICQGIPNDELIYVCKTGCDEHLGTGRFDAYFRVSDGEIPDVIKNCEKPAGVPQGSSGSGQRIKVPNNTQKDNLQLGTFKVEYDPPSDVPWLSPYCKPAIYLYPESATQVSVSVNPVGKFTYTNPIYPDDGWRVTAFPDGRILSNSREFPYLYYEADIPSLLIKKPDEGFVVEDSIVESKLNEILPELGLNFKESSEMISYWKKALPKSSYYFIGIIPESDLDVIAPISISPKPDNIIRVSLYFEPVDKKIGAKTPALLTPDRSGFTVVEWGGIVKTEKPFTCLQ